MIEHLTKIAFIDDLKDESILFSAIHSITKPMILGNEGFGGMKSER